MYRVRGSESFLRGNVPLARFLVRSSFRTGSHDTACGADNAGGTHAVRGTAPLCSLYGAGKVSTHPPYLVAATGSESQSILASGDCQHDSERNVGKQEVIQICTTQISPDKPACRQEIKR